MRTIQTSDGTQYKKPGALRTSAALYLGAAVSSAVVGSQMLVASPLMSKIRSLNTTTDKVELRKAVNTALADNKSGVKLVDFSGRTANNDLKEIAQKYLHEANEKYIGKNVSASEFFKGMSDIYKKIINKKILGDIINGANACFMDKKNKVLINLDKMGTSAFHEIGHAINYNNSKFWKMMQKTRVPMLLLPSAFLTIGMAKRKKAEGEEPKNTFDKATDFIKNNAGKLSTLAFVPVIAEETMATLRGNKMAKKLCSPELYKTVVKSSALGGLTYVAAAVLTGLGTFAGIKVKDSIAKPKQIKES